MDIRPIRTDADRDAAIGEIERLWDAPEGSRENDTLDVLATLVDAYDRSHHPMPTLSPAGVLRHAISDMGRSQKELADLLGSRSQASDLLRGRRPVSLAVARKVSAAWGLPIQLLVAPYESVASPLGSDRRRSTDVAA